MVRDEIDVVGYFVQHHLSMVDRLVIVDHLSQDGTFELLSKLTRRNSRLELLMYDGAEYFQSAIVSALVKREARRGATWILPLDADEFVAFKSRKEMVDALDFDPSPVKHLVWQNLVPTALASATAHSEDAWNGQSFVRSSGVSPHVKILLSGAYVKQNPLLIIGQGSHRVVEHPGAKPQRGVPVGVLYHVPVRSLGQALKKFANGAQSLGVTAGRDPSQGAHWMRLDESMKGGATISDLVRSGLHYGEEPPYEPADELVVDFTPLDDLGLGTDFEFSNEITQFQRRHPVVSGCAEVDIRVTIRGSVLSVRARRFRRTSRFWFRGRIALRVRLERLKGLVQTVARWPGIARN